MLSLTLRQMRAHARRLAGTGLAVMLGVAFLTGTLVLGDTLRANFDSLLTEVNAGVDVTVRNATDLGGNQNRGLIDASLVDRVAAVDGVATAEPVVMGYGQLAGPRRPGDRRERPAPAGRLWIDRRGPQPLPAGGRAGAGGRRRGRRQPGHGRQGRPADRRHHHAAHARAAAGHDRRHRDLRPGRGPGRRDVHGPRPGRRPAVDRPLDRPGVDDRGAGRAGRRRGRARPPGSAGCCRRASRRPPAPPSRRRRPTTSPRRSSTCSRRS